MKIKESLEEEVAIARASSDFAAKDLDRIKKEIQDKIKSGDFDSVTLKTYSKSLKYQENKIERNSEKINAYLYFLNLIKCEENGLL